MSFLDIPVQLRNQRSNSTENFAIEEDQSSELGDGINMNNQRRSSATYDFCVCLQFSSHRFLRNSLGVCSLVVFLLVTAVIVLTIFYMSTFAPYEVCRTKQCTRTATLFIRTMDDTVNPCDDFYKFACGNWITDTATVVSVALYDHTTIMRDRIIGRLRSLTESITSTDIQALQQVKRMYDTCTDLEAIEDAGVQPLVDLVVSLVNANTSLASTLALIRRQTGQSYIFDMQVSADYTNTSQNIVFLDQPELPVAKAFFQFSPKIVQAYRILVNSVLNQIGSKILLSEEYIKDIPKAAKRVVLFENIFALSMTDEVNRTKTSMHNLISVRDLNRIFHGENEFGTSHFPSHLNVTKASSNQTYFNWTEYFTTLFAGSNVGKIDDSLVVNVNDMAYMHQVSDILRKTNVQDIKMYLMWQLLYSFGKDVTREFRSHLNAFSLVVDGTETTPNRHTECINLLDATLPFALTHKYVRKYVKRSIIEEASDMVHNIIRAFKEGVARLDWMDANTKKSALEKANRVRAFLGYPLWLPDPIAVENYHKGLNLTKDSFFSNMLLMMKWITEKDLEQFGQPVDPTWSSDSPAEADAFYDDELNAITFPSGFLQEPFIGMGLRSIDYGALGSVIGHELTHGFDTEGRKSDGLGRLDAWWSLDTLQDFMAKASCFVKQYDQYWLPELGSIPGENNTVKGEQTLAENIADNGGIRGALQAYRYYILDSRNGVPEPRLPGLEKYEPEQLFFLSFAQSWCSYMNTASLLDMIQTNVHSPAKFRIWGPLSNFDEFSNIWQCSSNSRLNPRNKCVLW